MMMLEVPQHVILPMFDFGFNPFRRPRPLFETENQQTQFVRNSQEEVPTFHCMIPLCDRCSWSLWSLYSMT